jgi:hypothetical protein
VLEIGFTVCPEPFFPLPIDNLPQFINQLLFGRQIQLVFAGDYVCIV